MQIFRKRVLTSRDRLMGTFGIIKRYDIRTTFRWDSVQPDKVSSDPYDHVVYADVDLSDKYAFVFGANIQEVGFVSDDMDISDEDAITPETDDFKLEADVKFLARQDALIRLGGTLYGGTSLELNHLASGLSMEIWGLARSDAPAEFYKETIAEALSLELERRLKQSFFSYVTALDSLINFRLFHLSQFKELGHHITHLELKDKLSLAIKLSLAQDAIAKLPLVGTVTSQFGSLVEKRSDIAHSIKRISVEQKDIDKLVYTLILLMMIFERSTVDISSLTQHYDLKKKVAEVDRIPTSN